MEKKLSLLLCFLLVCICTSACNTKPPTSMVKTERRFAKYIEPPKSGPIDMIDLSEGPKLKYNANFGPKAPNFDFKIVDPY